MKKKSISRQFHDFKVRHGLSTMEIQKMSQEYADSGPDQARTYFSEKYNISEKVFYRAKDFAVICMLVDYKTSQRIIAKSAFNSSQHNKKESDVKSKAHSEYLLKMRVEFLNEFSPFELSDICRKYAEGLKLEVIADQYDTGVLAIKNLLKKGILAGYVDESTYQLIALRIKLLGHSINDLYKK